MTGLHYPATESEEGGHFWMSEAPPSVLYNRRIELINHQVNLDFSKQIMMLRIFEMWFTSMDETFCPLPLRRKKKTCGRSDLPQNLLQSKLPRWQELPQWLCFPEHQAEMIFNIKHVIKRTVNHHLKNDVMNSVLPSATSFPRLNSKLVRPFPAGSTGCNTCRSLTPCDSYESRGRRGPKGLSALRA